ncbi:hypothetical protein WT08_00030 [Burkholderia sp. MSMB1552]|nr:hypothetical protein WT08_00030 [Burkholderia sp. MSMB1552]KWZ51889.1 hypothetical protein WS92_17770 [Burkholderia sp. MSMB1588]
MASKAEVNEPAKSRRDILEAMRAALQAYEPESKMSNLDYVREMFDLLEEKLKKGATYSKLSELLKGAGIDIKDGTLKTMMSKIRAERKVQFVKCPCCKSEVPESQIGEQYRDNRMSEQAGELGEAA